MHTRKGTLRRESVIAAVKQWRGHQPVCRRCRTSAWRTCECTADTVINAMVALLPLCHKHSPVRTSSSSRRLGGGCRPMQKCFQERQGHGHALNHSG